MSLQTRPRKETPKGTRPNASKTRQPRPGKNRPAIFSAGKGNGYQWYNQQTKDWCRG